MIYITGCALLFKKIWHYAVIQYEYDYLPHAPSSQSVSAFLIYKGAGPAKICVLLLNDRFLATGTLKNMQFF